ncbi:MAG: S41 family peptidase [Methylococcales bacterium]
MHTLLRQSLAAIAMASVLLPTGLQADQAKSSTLDGIWNQRGYGNILSIKEGTYNLHEVTSISCIKTEYGPLEDLEDDLDLDSLEITANGNLWGQESGTAAPIAYERIPALPEQCSDGGTSATSDPQVNFDILWHTFNEYYAFFDRRFVDWQAQYDLYRPQVTAKTTGEELETIFKDMLAPLTDGHVVLETTNSGCEDGCETDNFLNLEVFQRLIAEIVLNSEDQSVDIDEFVADVDEQANKILDGYFDEPLKQAANEEIEWGTIHNSIGYLRISSMEDYSPDDDTSVETQAIILETALDQIMDDFQGLRGVIVDVRDNGGGYDAFSLSIANRFVDEKRLAYTKQARDGDGKTKPTEVYIKPQGAIPYTGSVAVLTSELTVSAAETFTLAMKVLPHVTTIGDKTQGILSDTLGKELPANDWFFTLSNEVYTAANGRVYEETGIPADIPWPFLSKRDREREIDGAIELALMHFDETTCEEYQPGHNDGENRVSCDDENPDKTCEEKPDRKMWKENVLCD